MLFCIFINKTVLLGFIFFGIAYFAFCFRCRVVMYVCMSYSRLLIGCLYMYSDEIRIKLIIMEYSDVD